MQTGVDVGGTFTDVVAWDGTRFATGKVPTTVRDQANGVLAGIEGVAGDGGTLRHGTTAATNALLERRGARTVLVTDAGFEDVVEIGRQDRPSLYDTAVVRTEPLAGRGSRVGAEGRTPPPRPVEDRLGDGVGSPSRADGRGWGGHEEVAARVAALDPEAVAVSLLYSFLDPARERAAAAAITSVLPGVPVSLSSLVAPEFREYERTSTTLVNAYLMPEVSRYLRSLHDRSGQAGVHGPITVMRSSGGLMPLEDAAMLPAAILLSGPAGGVVAAAELGRALGHEHLISFDMGGTSTDVCRVDHGRPDVAYERAVGGLPCRMPAVAVHTVGAGGGSIGWVDAGGALRVGPHSAGAEPGPACYARGGTDAAVTDANLFLGRLATGTELGGGLVLDGDPSRAAIGRLAERAGLAVEATALGILRVVETHMHRAIRAVSVEEGADPRSAVLVAFGGAGGLHATALARRLGMAGVVVPAHAGVFSALGLLLAPPRADAARGVVLEVGDGAALDRAVEQVTGEAKAALAAAGETSVAVETLTDVRYRGQSHETAVPYRVGEGWERLAERFHRAHERRNGFARPGDPIEVVTVRAEVVGAPALRWDQLPSPAPVGEPHRGQRAVLTTQGERHADVWWRPALAPGDRMVGPAVIEEPEATTFLDRGERAVVHDGGALEVSW